MQQEEMAAYIHTLCSVPCDDVEVRQTMADSSRRQLGHPMHTCIKKYAYIHAGVLHQRNMCRTYSALCKQMHLILCVAKCHIICHLSDVQARFLCSCGTHLAIHTYRHINVHTNINTMH